MPIHVVINILFSPQVMAGTVQKPPEFEEALERKRASLVIQLVKNPLAMWETWVRSLGWEDPLERERLPTPVFWPGEFRRLYRSRGSKESDRTERLSLSL